MTTPSSQSDPRRLETKPRNTLTPYILDVFLAELPVGEARVVAHRDTRTGQVWRTSGAAVRVPLAAIRDAVEASQR